VFVRSSVCLRLSVCVCLSHSSPVNPNTVVAVYMSVCHGVNVSVLFKSYKSSTMIGLCLSVCLYVLCLLHTLPLEAIPHPKPHNESISEDFKAELYRIALRHYNNEQSKICDKEKVELNHLKPALSPSNSSPLLSASAEPKRRR